MKVQIPARRKTVRYIGHVSAASLLILFLLPVRAVSAERRCGWLENPTPGNFSLRDRGGEWVLGVQGGYEAQGFDSMPDMTTAGWVETNGHYCYGCACLNVATDPKRKQVICILSARPVLLGQCRADRQLPRP